MISRVFLFILIAFLHFSKVSAQAPADKVLLEKMDLYSKANPSNVLFVHTDKTIYTNNETLWFSAYLLKSESADLKSHTILSVALMREDNRDVQLEEKYVIQDGLGFGSLSLPDSIPPGNYQFIASTNVLDKNGQPVAIFTQAVTLKSITQQNFNATLSLLDTVVTNGMIRAKVTVDIKTPVQKVKAGVKTEKVAVKYNVGNRTSKLVMLNENSYIMNIPAADLNLSQSILFTSVKYNEEVQHLSIKLPEIILQGVSVHFFPEGGYLVDGLESMIGWEAKTNGNMPIKLSGVLYKNEHPIDTISTNSYGIGTFRLKADNKSQYSLRISSNSYLKKDTAYSFPKVLENGLLLHLPDAVVNDTLRMTLFSKEARTVKVLVHNYQEIYASFSVRAHLSGSKASIALEAIPRGLATVTVLDEESRPAAEQLFFAHYKYGVKASIETDKDTYSKRDSVHVKLKLTDENGNPTSGILSIAVVQDNRMESGKQQDIESYAYLNDPLGNLPQDPQGRGFNNIDYLKNILLVKGWRRYTWQNLINSSPSDTIRQSQSPVIKAYVRYNDKPLKKPVSVSVLRDSLFDLLTTEIDGSFILSKDHLLTREGRKVLLSVNERNKAAYTVEVTDPYIQINKKLTGQVEISNSGSARISQNSKDQELEGLQRSIALQTVTINAYKGDDLYGAKRGPNACGDYVCIANILNCHNHWSSPGNRPPVKGETYKVWVDLISVRPTVYAGCVISKEIFKIDGIYSARDFYGTDVSSAGLLEPQFLSTLFWRPGEIAKSSSGSELSFFTGDITGPFRIVVQGVGKDDVVFGERKFTVK